MTNHDLGQGWEITFVKPAEFDQLQISAVIRNVKDHRCISLSKDSLERLRSIFQAADDR